MAKKGLGKGIGALLEENGLDPNEDFSKGLKSKVSSENNAEKKNDLLIDVDLLKPNPQQPRTDFDENALEELAQSIKEHGIIQPILVEEIGDGSYYIIAGERRTRAAKLAGLKQVPVNVRKFSDEKKLEIALIENIQRENLNPVEEAKAYYKLMEMTGLSQEEVAQKVGKNRSTVTNSLRLLKLPEDMLSSLSAGEITAGHARAILSVNAADQRILFAKIVGSGLSVRDAERCASEMNGAKPEKKVSSKAQAKNTELASIEQMFIEKLGTKVQIKGDFQKGTVIINYFSRDDLTRLYEILSK